QAEDGIRDWSVTGVQTCALPIFNRNRLNTCSSTITRPKLAAISEGGGTIKRLTKFNWISSSMISKTTSRDVTPTSAGGSNRGPEIGRASCREREEVVVDGATEKR